MTEFVDILAKTPNVFLSFFLFFLTPNVLEKIAEKLILELLKVFTSIPFE